MMILDNKNKLCIPTEKDFAEISWNILFKVSNIEEILIELKDADIL